MTSFGALKESIVHRQALGGLGLWKKRVLILQDDVIYLFSSDKKMEAANSILIAGITAISEVPVEESKREHTFRIEYVEKAKDSDEPSKPLTVLLACAYANEVDSWRDTIEAVRAHESARRVREAAHEEGGEWGLVRPLGRELLRASKSILKNTVMMTGMLKSLLFGPGAAAAFASAGASASAGGGTGGFSDSGRVRDSVNLDFFHSAIGEMAVLLSKDIVKFLGSPFDATFFQNVSESAKQMINLLATVPKLARGTSNEAAVLFHSNSIQQDLQRVRKIRLPRPMDQVQCMMAQLQDEMQKLQEAGDSEDRVNTSKMLNNCGSQFVESCKYIVDILDSKEEGEEMLRTAKELGPAIDSYRAKAKTAFYFRQSTDVYEEKRQIFELLATCAAIVASVDTYVSSSKKIRETMLITAPPAFMEYYDDDLTDDGSEESSSRRVSRDVGGFSYANYASSPNSFLFSSPSLTNRSYSNSPLGSYNSSHPHRNPPRLQLEALFASSPPTLPPSILKTSLNLPPPPNIPLPPLPSSPPLSPVPGLPSSPPASFDVASYAAQGTQAHDAAAHDEGDPFGGDATPLTFSSDSFLAKKRVLISPRERSTSYNTTIERNRHGALRERSNSSGPHMMRNTLTPDQENAWDSLLADAENFAAKQKRMTPRSPLRFAVPFRGSPASPLRFSSIDPVDYTDFSPLVTEIATEYGDPTLPNPPSSSSTSTPNRALSPTYADQNRALSPARALSPTRALSPARALSPTPSPAKTKPQKVDKKKGPNVTSGSNAVNAPIIPSFLTQPAAKPSPTPLSPTPTSTPISPTITSTPASSTPTTLPLPSTTSAPLLPAAILPPSLPPIQIPDIPTPEVLTSAPTAFKRASPRKLDEGEEREREGEVPAELAAIFKQQVQMLAQQQQQIMQKQQELIQQQFTAQKKALETIQRQALFTYKNPSTATEPLTFQPARPSALATALAQHNASLSLPTSPSIPINSPPLPTTSSATDPLATTPRSIPLRNPDRIASPSPDLPSSPITVLPSHVVSTPGFAPLASSPRSSSNRNLARVNADPRAPPPVELPRAPPPAEPPRAPPPVDPPRAPPPAEPLRAPLPVDPPRAPPPAEPLRPPPPVESPRAPSIALLSDPPRPVSMDMRPLPAEPPRAPSMDARALPAEPPRAPPAEPPRAPSMDMRALPAEPPRVPSMDMRALPAEPPRVPSMTLPADPSRPPSMEVRAPIVEPPRAPSMEASALVRSFSALLAASADRRESLNLTAMAAESPRPPSMEASSLVRSLSASHTQLTQQVHAQLEKQLVKSPSITSSAELLPSKTKNESRKTPPTLSPISSPPPNSQNKTEPVQTPLLSPTPQRKPHPPSLTLPTSPQLLPTMLSPRQEPNTSSQPSQALLSPTPQRKPHPPSVTLPSPPLSSSPPSQTPLSPKPSRAPPDIPTKGPTAPPGLVDILKQASTRKMPRIPSQPTGKE